MADLEGAAAATLARLRELKGEIDAAQGPFERLGEQASATAAEIDSEWNGTVDRVNAFLEHVGERQRHLATAVAEAGEALNALGEGAAEARATAEEELGRARTDTDGLAELVTAAEPTVAGLAQSVDALFRALSEQARALEESLEQAVGEARQFLQDQAAALKDLQDDVREAGEEAGRALEECARMLEDSYESWVKGVDEVEETVERAFAATAAHLHESVDLAVDECTAGHDEALETFAPQAGQAEQALGEVSVAAEAAGDAVEAAMDTHAAAMGRTEDALRSATAALESVRSLLAQYTFVEL